MSEEEYTLAVIIASYAYLLKKLRKHDYKTSGTFSTRRIMPTNIIKPWKIASKLDVLRM